MPKHAIASWAVFVVCVVAVPAYSAQGGFLGFGGGSKTDFLTFTDPGGRFSLDYPKDWQIAPGQGDVIATFGQKKGEAFLVVERFQLKLALMKEDITEVFAGAEVDVLRERQPKATDIVSKFGNINQQRMIVIDYNRRGLSHPERARQYSIPIGQDLFRLGCSAVATEFAKKYDAIFAHVAESFKILPSRSSTDGR